MTTLPVANAFARNWWVILIRGITDLVAALLLRKHLKNISELVIAGLVSIIFGGWMLANPGRGALAMILIIGGYALVFGVVMIVHELRWRTPAAVAS